MPDTRTRKIPTSAAIFLLMLATALVLVTCIVAVMKYESNATSLDSAETLFNEIATKTVAEVTIILESVATLTDTASYTLDNAYTLHLTQEFERNIPVMRAILDAHPDIMSLYIGHDDGTFQQLFATHGDPAVRERFAAPPATAYIHRVITTNSQGEPQETWRLLDEALRSLEVRREVVIAYDPRSRPWYHQAKQGEGAVFSPPYVFSSSGLPGLTCAKALGSGLGVLGVDVTLTRLSALLAGQRVATNGAVWILDDQGRVIAHRDLAWSMSSKGSAEESFGALQLPRAMAYADPLVREVARAMAALKGAARDKPFFVEVNGATHVARAVPMSVAPGVDFSILVAAPLADITGHINTMAFRMILISVVLLLAGAPVAVVLARNTAGVFGVLAREAAKVQRFDFSPSPPIETRLKEVQEVATAFESMKATIQAKTESLVQTREKLELLVQESLGLSHEKRLDKLVAQTCRAARKLSGADGGVLYLLEGEALAVKLLSLGDQDLSLVKPLRFALTPAAAAHLPPDSVLGPVFEACEGKQTVLTRDRPMRLFPTGLPQEAACVVGSQVSVPVVTQRGELLGVIQIFNVGRDGDASSSEAELAKVGDFVGALAAQMAVTLDNRNLIQSLQTLFDALVQVVASSIDAKSPYTAGHCSRVPEVAELLAKAVDQAREGPFKDFRLQGEDDWRQLWLAAWLHDCGKLTTPEHVVDKATKLETVHNRIHEVRMRFEVLWRDAQLDYHRRLAEGEEKAALDAWLAGRLEALRDDFAFVARVNRGGESLSDEEAARLEAIARRTWVRRFNDRLGVSQDELRRMGDAAPEAPGQTRENDLAVTERLLDDKPEHVVERRNHYPDLTDVEGNPIAIPPHEYNKGELYNLLVQRGTLTREERFKINEHALNGLRMLQQIPFPESLGKVVAIATEHHETLVGTGYPFKKRKEQLSVESRILAIADIFEALTARDRPYKEAKTLSQALGVMSRMRDEAHIDPDLFDIFLKEGVFHAYAAKRLDPSQRDVEDIAPYLSDRDQQGRDQ